MRGFPILALALIADGLQAAIGLGITGVTMGVTTAVGWIPVIGQVVAGGTNIAGLMFSTAIDVSLSIAFGTIITTILIFNGMFRGSLLLFGGVEILPFMNMLPSWTAMVARAMILKKQEEKRKMASAQGAQPEVQLQEIEVDEEIAYVESPSIDGIRAPARRGVVQGNYVA